MLNQRLRALLPMALAATFLPMLGANGPTRYATTQRYHDIHPVATGRSGNAAMQGRALLAKNGTTSLEFTTGSFDPWWGTTAPGNISKVQVKGFDASGSLRYIKNYNGLSNGGTDTFTTNDLLRGQAIQAQGNIDGIDQNRTDVVTANLQVRLRPDLAVTSFTGPTQTTLMGPTPFTVTVAEKNLDNGALSNVVLYDETGKELDRVNWVWCDAGGLVSLAFTVRFPAPGDHTLTVKVEDVNPGDYDYSNNQATTQISVLNKVKMGHFATVSDSAYHYTTHSSGFYGDSSYNFGGDWSNTNDQSGWNHSTTMFAFSPKAMAWPLKSFQVTESTDGAPVSSMTLTNLAPNWTDSYTYGDYTSTYSAGYAYDPATDAYINIYSFENDYQGAPVWQSGQAYYSRYAGQAVYFSSSYNHYWYGSNDNTYSWAYTYTTQNGVPRTQLGSSYMVSMSIADQNDTAYNAESNMTLVPFNNSWSNPPYCFTYDWGTYTYGFCFDSSSSTVGVNGMSMDWDY